MSNNKEGGEEQQQQTAAKPGIHSMISKKEAMKNWMQFDMAEDLAEALIANNFKKPTDV